MRETRKYTGIIKSKSDFGLDYIWKKVRGNEETKTELLEYMWDVIMDDRKEREKLKEWFFDGVCHLVECDDQGRVKGYFEQ